MKKLIRDIQTAAVQADHAKRPPLTTAANFLTEFAERIKPIERVVRRIHPDTPDETVILTIPGDPRVDLTVGHLRQLTNLKHRQP